MSELPTSNVQRYARGYGDMEKDRYGTWVLFDDYERLQRELTGWRTGCTGKHGSQTPCVTASEELKAHTAAEVKAAYDDGYAAGNGAARLNAARAGFEPSALRDRVHKLQGCCHVLIGLADEARELIDKDKEVKALKLLTAVTGHCPGYRADVDSVRATIHDCAVNVTAQPPEDGWVIYYEDRDEPAEHFYGEGAEAAARYRFEQRSMAWTCRLFRCIAKSGYGPAPTKTSSALLTISLSAGVTSAGRF